MTEQRRETVSITAEVDDFAARYDRMAAAGSGFWAVKVGVALVILIVVLGVLGALLSS